ncbi:hypothetical protein B5F54_11880 [Anaeromassilibacillus sp. An250]|nr:hypothetical protein B5F54_11880 [Anaeromassilibacillus sp. An250]
MLDKDKINRQGKGGLRAGPSRFLGREVPWRSLQKWPVGQAGGQIPARQYSKTMALGDSFSKYLAIV